MFTDPRFKKITYQIKNTPRLDQYKNPSKQSILTEILKWFDKENIEFISSIPFDFNSLEPIFKKKRYSLI